MSPYLSVFSFALVWDGISPMVGLVVAISLPLVSLWANLLGGLFPLLVRARLIPANRVLTPIASASPRQMTQKRKCTTDASWRRRTWTLLCGCVDGLQPGRHERTTHDDRGGLIRTSDLLSHRPGHHAEVCGVSRGGRGRGVIKRGVREGLGAFFLIWWHLWGLHNVRAYEPPRWCGRRHSRAVALVPYSVILRRLQRKQLSATVLVFVHALHGEREHFSRRALLIDTSQTRTRYKILVG